MITGEVVTGRAGEEQVLGDGVWSTSRSAGGGSTAGGEPGSSDYLPLVQANWEHCYKRYFWRSGKCYHVGRRCCGWVEEWIWEEGVWIPEGKIKNEGLLTWPLAGTG